MKEFLDYIPICAVCKRPVDFFEQELSPETAYIKFKASCHRKEEVYILDTMSIDPMTSITVGEAFSGGSFIQKEDGDSSDDNR